MASFRSELMEGDANGIFPLHIAVWHKAPASVVKEMIELAPEAVSKKTTSGYYPLDYAKLFNNEDEVRVGFSDDRCPGVVTQV